ncbi:unnamed protein product, partial [Menidia menidia]
HQEENEKKRYQNFTNTHKNTTVKNKLINDLIPVLTRIDQSKLPGKYKVWCYQFTLYQRLLWPLKMSEIPSSTVSKMDMKANSFIRKWLGLPRCISEAGLFGRNMLQLPLRSLQLGYKQKKTRLVLELRESTDESVRNANARVLTGRKWNAQTEVDQAVSQLQHKEIVGRVQRVPKARAKKHKANGPNVAEGRGVTEEEGPLVENKSPREHEDPVLTTPDRTEPITETKKPARRNKIKWPKSSEAEAWRVLDADLIKTLQESLRGGAVAKLNRMGDIIYQTCKDRFGETVPRQRSIQREKGRERRKSYSWCKGVNRTNVKDLFGRSLQCSCGFHKRLLWPIKMSEIPSSTVSRMDGKANSFIRKWLGLPRCISEAGLFGMNMLQLPLRSLQLGYKQEETRLVLELRESTDESVRNANARGDVPVTAPPPGDVPGLKGRNVDERWFLADDPAADPWAPEEVRQAAMPGRI